MTESRKKPKQIVKPRRSMVARPASAERGSTNVGIITMRPDEFLAVHRRLSTPKEFRGKNRNYHVARVRSRGGQVTQVALTRCLNQGPNEAQSVAEDLIQDLSPKWILLVGIAGGTPSEDFTLGDVVVSSRLIDFTVWAAQPGGKKEFDGLPGNLHPAAVRLVTELPGYIAHEFKGWNKEASIGERRPVVSPLPALDSETLKGPEKWREKVVRSLKHHFEARPRGTPLAIVGPTASSGALVKDPVMLQTWLTSARSALNVEMEFAGVLAAAARHDVPVLNIRGTSDIVGLTRKPEWTKYACESAAALAKALVETGRLATQLSSEALFLIDLYRTRMQGRFDIWDLGSAGITQVGGAARPITAALDKMFVPLRLIEPTGQHLGLGETMGPEKVVLLSRPLLIRGPAGSGKTTWSRWIFRRLVSRADALPLLLTTRELARRWSETNAVGEQRSIDRYLFDTIREHLGQAIGREEFDELLKAHNHQALPLVRIILIVDGWDELGPLGTELRDKLNGFLQAYRHVAVVVTSRPYGTAPPTGSGPFDERDISPLSAEDISDFAVRFFEECYGEERTRAIAEAERFWHALSSSPSALSLARTVLMLTMMLLIGRVRPLPDKRHRLYQECIENLLTALPTRRAQGGALLDDTHWCPPDTDERIRAVAHMAFRMHTTGTSSGSGVAIFSASDELEQMLPATWPSRDRRRFLSWLVGPCGILSDRSDGTMAFAHLSFQEYLAAWHLNATVEGSMERNEVFGSYLGSPGWWETLLLWAAVLDSQSPDRLRPVLQHLKSAGSEGIALAGLMMADGLASETEFREWLDVAIGGPDATVLEALRRLVASWKNSRQDARRQKLREALARRAARMQWADWFRLTELLGRFDEASVAESTPQLPTNELDIEVVRRVLEGTPRAHAGNLAIGRVLVQTTALDVSEPNELALLLLNLWPSYRVVTGQRLQLAAMCGATRNELFALGAYLVGSVALTQSEKREAIVQLTRSIPAGKVTPEWMRDFVNSLPGDLARSHVNVLANFRTPVRMRDFRSYSTGADVGGPSFARLADAWAATLATSSTVDPRSPWLESFAFFDLWLAAPCFRWSLAFGQNQLPLRLSSIREACRESLTPPASGTRPVRVETSLPRGVLPGPIGMWEALLRVVRRTHRGKDQQVLEKFARGLGKRSSLGLLVQFVVRGDVLLREGGVLSLDEICKAASKPCLPLVQPPD